MTDPLDPPAEPENAAGLETDPSVTDSTPADSGGRYFASGQHWRAYELGEKTGSGPVQYYQAINLKSMEPMIVRVAPIDPAIELRRQVWVLLQDLNSENALPLIEATEEDGHRFEVTAAPPPTTLREWLATHHADPHAIEQAVRQLTPVITELHLRGLAHLNLRPETIYVTPGTQGLTFEIGGLEDATPIDQGELVSVGVDPFYAPPEAAGLFLHEPGTGLGAWDWWSLGRVLQEFLLGRHVLGFHLNRDVSRITPELRLRAEALLTEKDPAGVRAGAVELMSKLDPGVERLLRGLLTGLREGRWRSREVKRWLDGSRSPDRYDLPRQAHLFVWKDEAFTVAEAAELFAQEENWDDGEVNLFSPPEDSTTLVSFLAREPTQTAVAERLRAVLAKVDLPAWKGLPLEVRRTALAAAAWCVLSDAGAPAKLRLRGRRLDWIGLHALVDAAPAEAIAPLLKALTSKPYIELVDTLDAEAARSLTLLAQSGREAINQAVDAGWLEPDDLAAQGEIMHLAVMPAREVDARLQALRSTYAITRTPVLDAHFSAPKPERWKVLLLVHTGRRPDRFLYVSHAEYNLERHQQLEQRCAKLAVFVFWKELQRILRFSPWFFLPWWIAGPGWLALAVILHARTRDPVMTLMFAAVVLALRGLLHLQIRGRVKRHDPGAPPWSWRDGPHRCQAEAERVRPAEAEGAAIGTLSRQVRSLAAEMAAIPLDPRPASRVRSPGFSGLQGGAAAGLMAALVAISYLARAPAVADSAPSARVDSAPPASVASGSAAAAPPLLAQPVFVPPPPGFPPGSYEEVNDGFGRQVRGPLQAWDIPPDRVGPPLVVRQRLPASANQTAHARIEGERLLRPYPSKGFEAILAVRVPTEAGAGVGLMLFDTGKRVLIEPRVLLVPGTPQAKVWTQLGDHRVVFLGDPPPVGTALPEPPDPGLPPLEP